MADVDPDEFWHLAPAGARPRSASAADARRLFPKAPTVRTRSQEARWLIPRIDAMRAEELLSLLRVLDDVLNNTSLILLFSIGDARLLFPGDAQLENWRYALDTAKDHDGIRSRLAQTTVYKVGHHGSLNATPRKSLWDGFAHRGPAGTPDRLITVLSTAAGKHGSVSRSTEVPRKTLVDELTAESELFNTQDCSTTIGWWREVPVPLVRSPADPPAQEV